MKSFPKPVRVKDESRLAWCRKQECVVRYSSCGFSRLPHSCNITVDAHHVSAKGAGGSDFTTLPLCREAHMMYHNYGRKAFEEWYDVNLDKLLAEHNTRYRKEVKPKRKTRTPSVKLKIEGICANRHRVKVAPSKLVKVKGGWRWWCDRCNCYQEVA